TEDLIRMVDQGEIPMTVVDSDIAELNKSYYPRLDIGMKISLDQYSSWAVRNDCDSLAVKIDKWEKKNDNSELLKSVYKKYFEISRNNSPEDDDTSFTLNVRNGVVSPYDETFKRHAHVTGYDWQLLAAIGYNESRFNNSVVSWAGAKGLMQLMPATARAMGISAESLQNPDANVLAAARLIKKLDASLETKIPEKAERMKFVVAAYNCGLGHIYDAIALAGKYGLDPKIWTGSVSEAALMKSRPQYYNDPVVKNGYFRGRETTEFVERVMNAYNYYKKHTD
ncbi:MAG: transglycosylase SLT domain-containing protein, partial [Muribaculaceae bacterium]|nr:transglycosylase SLT domain-containing protein [Muribaculaceae bacterium]